MELLFLMIFGMLDPVFRAMITNQCYLRSYQAEAIRGIFDAVMAGRGGRFAVTFPRQSGKNETQAQLEAAVMAASQYKGGTIVKIIPTEKNQGKISTERLAGVLRGTKHNGGERSETSSPKHNGDERSEALALKHNGGERSEAPAPNLLGEARTLRGRHFLAAAQPAQENRPLVRSPLRNWTHTGTVPQCRLRGISETVPMCSVKVKKDEIVYGNTNLRCLSASPNAAIVGATADLMLEVDEAQMVSAEKFDREAAPMAASTNAVQVFWGTAWDDQTLLARETRLAYLDEKAEEAQLGRCFCCREAGIEEPSHCAHTSSQLDAHRDGSLVQAALQQENRPRVLRPHVFTTTCVEVGQEVPSYAEFVKGQIERLGREHPAIRTQFFCEEITDLTSMFTADRINKMKGDHAPLYGPEKDSCYVFLIDVAESDELTAASKKANGFSDRRDATVVTICEVSLPEDKAHDKKNFVWKVVARRLYRNTRNELLEKDICSEIDLWKPLKIIIDHSGMGAMLSDILTGKYRNKVVPIDITAANKTKMAWDFLAMVDTGRWIEHKGNDLKVLKSGFVPGKDRHEMLKEPELLQQMFFRELRACRIEPTGNEANVRWGVKDGTRDHATGRMLHDDLVMSAAMAVFEDGSLPLCNTQAAEAWAANYREIQRMLQAERDNWFSY